MMDVSMDTVSVEIEAVVKNSGKSVDELIDKLNSLQNALKNTGKNSKNLPLNDQLKKLGVSLNDKDIISKVRSIGKEVTKYKNSLGQVITVQKNMKGDLEDYKVTVKDTFKKTSDLEKFKKSIAGIATQIGLFVGTIKTVSNKMNEYVDLSASYVESLNLFFTEMGKKGEQAYEWVQMFSNALYLDPADVMQYMGAFNSLVSGLGVGADRSYLMSKNLTQLTYDLASYKNLDFVTAYEKLMSGISGEIEPLRNTGVALSQNTLQELANSLGIEKRISAMNEAEKAELRYIQILRSSKNWQGDLGKTLNSTENILKTAGQQWTLFKRALGDVATVIVRYALPYLVALSQILTEVAKSLANFLGFKIDFSKYKTDTKGVSQGISQIGDEADTTTKKLNTMLAPFDKLNVVQNKSESASSGVGSSSSGLGVDLPEYDALSKLTGDWAKEVEKAKEKLKSMLPTIATVAGALAGVWAIDKIANFIRAIKTITSALKALGDMTFFKKIGGLLSSIPAFKGLADAFSGIGKAIGAWLKGGGSFAGVIKSLAPLLSSVAQVIAGIGLVFVGIQRTISGIKKILEGDTFKGVLRIIEGIALVVAGIAVLLGGWVVALVAGVVAGVALVIEYWEEIKAFFVDLWENIKQGFSNLWQSIVDFFQPVIDWFSNAIENVKSFFTDLWNKIVEIFTAIGDWFNKNVIQPIVDVFTPIVDWFKELFGSIWQTISDIFQNIVGIFEGTWEIIKLVWGIVSDWFNENVIQPVGEFFVGLWETIKTTASELWEDIKSIFMVVAEWVDKHIIQPVVKTMSSLWDGLKSGAKKAWEGIKSVFSTVADFFKNTFQKAWEGVKKVFSIGGKIFDGIKEGIVNAFKTVANAIIGGINKVVSIPFNGINKALEKIKNVDILGLKPFEDKIKTINVPQIPLLGFEQGGYPDKASLFFANENGIPELVGRIGNQTAVANNDQITTALTSALLTALSGADLGGQGTIVVNIGNKKVYEGMGEHIDSESERYGTSYVNL